MSRTKRENEPPAIIELLLPLAGLMLVAVFFLPGFRNLLGTLLFVSFGLIALSLVIGMALFIRHHRKLAQLGASPAAPAAAPTAWTMELLGRLEWKRFEELVAAYVRELGYSTNPADSPIPGQAVVLFKNGRTQPAMLVQCKPWDAGAIGLGPVRELQVAMTSRQVGYGAFYTSGEFAAEAAEFAQGKILDLVDGREFLHRLGQLTPAAQKKLLEDATSGDYTTPTCPGCDIKMVPLADGSRGWGCRNHPQCRRTLRVA